MGEPGDFVAEQGLQLGKEDSFVLVPERGEIEPQFPPLEKVGASKKSIFSDGSYSSRA